MTAPWISHQRRSSGEGRSQPIRCNINLASGDVSPPGRAAPGDPGRPAGKVTFYRMRRPFGIVSECFARLILQRGPPDCQGRAVVKQSQTLILEGDVRRMAFLVESVNLYVFVITTLDTQITISM